MAKHQLDIEEEYEFDVVGICASVRPYKLVWAINQALNIQLVKETEDFEIGLSGMESKHSLFKYHDEQSHVSYELLVNKGTGGMLLPEQRQCDYLLLLHDNIILKGDEVVDKIRSVTFVTTSFCIDPASLRNRENLITS